jgi:2-polyprenyl-6-methoxyphenol hydroxylase-like FAD-dependent oxidoreductase
VEVRRGVRVHAAGEDGADAWVDGQLDDGSPIRLRAPWAVAADGARSEVREHLRIGLRWRDYGTDSAVADFEMDTHLPADISRIVLDPARPHGFFAFAPGRWRFIYRLNAGEDRRALTTEEHATELLRAHLPQARVRRFLWASAFRLGQGQSAAYRSGRWLLVGDAAHPMGPSAGAGMMVGLLGAWRLGPRLATVARGELDAATALAAYEREQRAGAREVQRANELIFRNMAIADPRRAALRSLALRGLGRLPALTRRMTATEALIRQDVRPGRVPA